MKALLAAEADRLKKKGYRAEKLKSALSWSNMDSGPQEVLKGKKLRERVLIIRPTDAVE